jgi:hypothetical protein
MRGGSHGKAGSGATWYVRDHLSDWEIEQASDEERRYMENMDQEELDSMWNRGDPFKNDSGT